MTSQLSITAASQQFSLNAANISNQRLYEGMVKNASISNQSIFASAVSEADKDTKNSKMAKARRALPLLAGAAFLGYCSLIRPGSLSAKIATAAEVLGLSAVAAAGTTACYKIKNKIQEKHDKREPDKRPTALGTFGAMAAFMVAGCSVFAALAKTGSGTKVVGHLKNLGKRIDNSWLAGKINTKAIDRFFKKHTIVKNVLFLTPVAGSLAGTSMLSKKLNRKFEEKVEENLKAYVQERENFRTAAKLLEQSGLVQPIVQEQPALKEISVELEEAITKQGLPALKEISVEFEFENDSKGQADSKSTPTEAQEGESAEKRTLTLEDLKLSPMAQKEQFETQGQPA